MEEIKIGNQIWMTKNLNIDKFRNGKSIPQAQTNEEWQKAEKSKKPAWCYYKFDSSNEEKYGKLYNWYAVNDQKGLAPDGWKVPSDEDWNELSEYLGGESIAGKKMKYTDFWNGFNDEVGNGTNESGFSGLPGGQYNNMEHVVSIGNYGYWWSSTSGYKSYYASFRFLNFMVDKLGQGVLPKENCLSVRCMKIKENQL